MCPSIPDRLSPRVERTLLAAVVLLFIGLGLWYSLVVPPFEKPDEVYHYAFARHLAQGNPLPVQTIEATGPWLHEGTQAPLYYFLLGRFIAGIDQGDFDRLNVQNPQVNLGVPLSPGNKNLMLYSSRPLPLRGTNLAVHVGRWFSLALGCLGLLLTCLTARLALPPRSLLPVLTVLLVAVIPQVAFIFSSVSNDSMITVVSLAVIYWLARLVARARAPVVFRSGACWGLATGLAAPSKLQGLVPSPAGLTILRTGLAASFMAAVRGRGGARCSARRRGGWLVVLAQLRALRRTCRGSNRLLTITGLRDHPRQHLERLCRRDERPAVHVLGAVRLVQYPAARLIFIRQFPTRSRCWPLPGWPFRAEGMAARRARLAPRADRGSGSSASGSSSWSHSWSIGPRSPPAARAACSSRC